MKTGICNLCQKEKPLLKKSHIIPDFFYVQGDLFDKHHQIIKLDVHSFIEKKSFSKVPTGVYDQFILCQACDNGLIGALETYGRKVLFGGLAPSEQFNDIHYKNPVDGFEYSIFENVDYKTFKLFLLSILWRAAISKNELFKDVIIPEDLKETLRQMIYNNNPGEYDDFPIIAMTYIKDESVPDDIIGQPVRSVNTKGTFITFLLTGFIFVFPIALKYKYKDSIDHFTPTPDNKFGVMCIPSGESWNFILKYVNLK